MALWTRSTKPHLRIAVLDDVSLNHATRTTARPPGPGGQGPYRLVERLQILDSRRA